MVLVYSQNCVAITIDYCFTSIHLILSFWNTCLSDVDLFFFFSFFFFFFLLPF